MFMKKNIFTILSILSAFTLFAGGYKTTGVVDVSTNDTSMIFSYTKNKTPHFEYYGKKISNPKDFIGLRTLTPSEMGEENPLYSARGGKNYIEPALSVIHFDGDLNTELRFVDVKKSTSDNGNIETTTISLKDTKYNFLVDLIYTAHKKENVITQRAEITNNEDGDITLQNFASSYVSLRAKKYFLTHINGQWAYEANVSEDELTRGTKSIVSRKLVRTTLSENPAFMLALNTPRNERLGEVIAGALVWNGNYKIDFDYDDFMQLNIISGIAPTNYKLKKGEKFITPEMVLTYSANGSGQASRNLHDWARNYGIYKGNQQRPIILNCWEGTGFDVNESIMYEIIDDAAELGAEIYVMDDGWFGSEKFPRDNAKAGLGDWQINKRKFPNGIAPIADYTVKKGMRFGIWIEPEMANPNSEIAQKHPDWIVGAKGREKPTIRYQWLLDLSNPEVQDFVFGVFDSVLKMSKNITYIKWDANRHLEQIGSNFMPADEQERFYIKYVEGLNNVYKRIRAKYPDILVQACASGGGRIDYASLKYCEEVWGSDNTNPFCRLFIQYGESLFYPMKAIGAHVPKSGSRGIETSMKFRTDVAMMGRFGIEMRPKNLPPDEYKELKRAVGIYKRIRNIVQDGDMYRLISPFEDKNFAANMFVSKDKSKAVAFIFQHTFASVYYRPFIKLEGLDPNKKYKVVESNISGKSNAPIHNRIVSGEYLMNQGINNRFNKSFMSVMYEITEVK
ncbi:MAG: alpha-galactosidase [Opitutales bacterium]|nr:alpha-galactosidase [Opitutales bacterium]